MAKVTENKDQNEDEDFVDELQPGTKLLHGQYTIEKFLNSGGFGITYLARDSLDRVVVIKECFPGALCRRGASRVGARSRAHQSEFKSVVESFVQEARSMAKLKHPNIVGVHQVFEDNDTAYMALDYIDGFDLLDNIEEGKGDLSPQDIARILRKLLSAVQFIHDRNILHRDISPDNILVDKATGEPLLIDFGAAREEVAKSSRVLSALRVVKDGYSPQEFYINGSNQGPSSDLYALAASFYHMVSGDPPPNSQNRLSALAQDEGDPYVPLADKAKYQKDYDVAFLSAIDKALNVFPKDRIQSADEWLALISSGVSDIAPKAVKAKRVKSEKPKEEVSQAKPPRKSKAPLLVASIFVLAAGAGGYAWQAGLIDLDEIMNGGKTPVVVTNVQEPPKVVVLVDIEPEAGAADAGSRVFDGTHGGNQELPAGVEIVKPAPENPVTGRVVIIPAEDPEPPVVVEPTGPRFVKPPVVVQPEPPVIVEPDPPVVTQPESPVVVEPKPPVVAEPTPSDPAPASTIAGVTVKTTVNLPFSNKSPFSTTPSLGRAIAKLGDSAPSWLRVGYSIVAVDGQQIKSIDEIPAIVSAGADIENADTVTAILSIAAFPGANPIPKEITLEVAHVIVLSSGLEFQTGITQDGTKQTVVSVSDGADGGMQVGDVVLGYMTTGEFIDVNISMLDLLQREVGKGVGSFSMAVTRDGVREFAPFSFDIDK